MDFLADTECVNYEVILSYSLVEYCTLIERNKKRTVDAIKLLIEDENLRMKFVNLSESAKSRYSSDRIVNLYLDAINSMN